ncbi:MAG: hypothetical protein AAF415_01365 [Pseudomonadota bacterium]
MKRALAALFAFILIGFAPAAAGDRPGEPDGKSGFPRALLHAGCNHYDNRARFLSREEPVDYVVLLAEACRAAEASLDRELYGERLAAEYFLKRVLRLRNTIIDMNMHRVFGDQTSPYAKPQTEQGDAAFKPVSPAGEFLIAHRMGVFDAYTAWLDSGAEFSIAFVK